ncbi:MAG: NERD domain-containing protein [Micrococcales bacterium]|nr:NERD domain-containing protein [Micrococcales bacterium]
MRLRYAGTCRVCAAALPARTEAVYERSTRTVRCLTHDVPGEGAPGTAEGVEAEEVSHDGLSVEGTAQAADPVESGTAGASARREFERRRARREERIRAKHPRLGGLILAVSEEPQSTTAWAVGAKGEEVLGRGLDALASDTIRLLHDRRIPGSRSNIDHLAVTPAGVVVIDAKRYRGRPHLRVDGGILRPRVERLFVGSRDCTKLVDGVLTQVEIVRGIVGEGVPVRGVLCFLDADWPLLGGAFTVRGVDALWPKRLRTQLCGDGPLAMQAVGEVHRSLAAHLPSS